MLKLPGKAIVGKWNVSWHSGRAAVGKMQFPFRKLFVISSFVPPVATPPPPCWHFVKSWFFTLLIFSSAGLREQMITVCLAVQCLHHICLCLCLRCFCCFCHCLRCHCLCCHCLFCHCLFCRCLCYLLFVVCAKKLLQETRHSQQEEQPEIMYHWWKRNTIPSHLDIYVKVLLVCTLSIKLSLIHWSH